MSKNPSLPGPGRRFGAASLGAIILHGAWKAVLSLPSLFSSTSLHLFMQLITCWNFVFAKVGMNHGRGKPIPAHGSWGREGLYKDTE